LTIIHIIVTGVRAISSFPIDLSGYRPHSTDLSQKKLTHEQKVQLETNISLLRDCIIFFTAYSNARGLGGHTGGAYDIVPEVLIADGFMRSGDIVYPAFFDEAGHRVALQYLMAALDDTVSGISTGDLLRYREYDSGLPGHPERDAERGIKFSSGRLGHLFGYVNGLAEQNPNKQFVLFGSDGAQQEGNDAESARYAVAQQLNISLILDDNDVTIEGFPSDYLPGFDVTRTLKGHGMSTDVGDGEDVESLYSRMQIALTTDGPAALINKRKMAPGVAGIEGTAQGHDAIPVPFALEYLNSKKQFAAVAMLELAQKVGTPRTFQGSSQDFRKNRSVFGDVLCDIFETLSPGDLKKNLVISSDLGGSCGLNTVGKRFPALYRKAGVMERNSFATAAGFGSREGYQGIMGTFSAFSEMIISETSMARLNDANVIAHFSHAGIDEIVDNTCHFGINIFFVDNGFSENDTTRLYFPADPHQLKAVMQKVFNNRGLRFIFSTRSGVPNILKEDGSSFFDMESGYRFEPGKDEMIREGSAGYVISYGEMLYRALDAVATVRKEGIDVGLVNKPTLNVVDENMMKITGQSSFVLVVETQSVKSGLGSKFGSWLLEKGHSPLFSSMGTVRKGGGGLQEQIPFQGLDTGDIAEKIRRLARKS
jgi:transketolase